VKKVSKGAAFVFGMCCMMGMFLIVVAVHIFKLAEANDLMVGSFLMGIGGLVTSYMGIDVANNAARGKYYKAEVAELDAKNRKEENEGGK
jgi:arginine exporter protein ArgO